MSDLIQSESSPANNFSQNFVLWIDRRVLWFAGHWLAAVNTFFLVYVGLPVLAPILLAFGFSGPANTIYSLYRAACHQLPSRSYFIFGEQVAFCQRDIAIYAALFLGGLFYGLARHRLKPLPLRWYILFLVPIAVDGGTQMVSQVLEAISITYLWIFGLVMMGVLSFILYTRKNLTWQSIVFFTFGPMVLLFLQFGDPHYHSDWIRRTLTGSIFGIGTVWFAYPYLEESFNEIYQEVSAKLYPYTPR